MAERPVFYSGHVDAPYLIGIAGHSGAGKTTLARRLAGRLTGTPEAVLPLDAYYLDRGGVPLAERKRLDFESPAAFDLPLLLEQLRQIAAGRTIARPVYDYRTHARRPETARLEPGRTVVVEGRLALYWEAVRALLAMRIFIACDAGTCLQRRLARDARERDRSAAATRAQWHATVHPQFRRYVEPTQRHADLVVDGAEPVEAAAGAILRAVAGRQAVRGD